MVGLLLPVDGRPVCVQIRATGTAAVSTASLASSTVTTSIATTLAASALAAARLGELRERHVQALRTVQLGSNRRHIHHEWRILLVRHVRVPYN